MTEKENAVTTAATVVDGRGKQKGKTSSLILRQSGQPVNDVFCCGFVHEVFDLLAEPITAAEIARRTCSPVDRVYLALHELRAAGVVIT